MIISNSLATTPFVSNTDATRLQMATKQLSQTTTHLSNEVPYVIGKNWTFLTESSRLFRYSAEDDGEVVFKNKDNIILLINNKLLQFNIHKYFHTSEGFCSEIRYVTDKLFFKKDELIFEYDCFKNNVPCYGYNINTMFFPFFGFNFEDCVVISESFSKKVKTKKIDFVIIPILSNTIYKHIYPNSKHLFIPEIGQSINDNVICTLITPKKSFIEFDIDNMNESNENFDVVDIYSKLKNSTVYQIKIHKIIDSSLLDIKTNEKIKNLYGDYRKELNSIFTSLKNKLGDNYAHKFFKQEYITDLKKDFQGLTESNICYIIEIGLMKEYDTVIGDKITTRYANKGIVNLIIPDNLRPINIQTGEPIDLILGPISIFSRMIVGQMLEGLISKAIRKSEIEILNKNYDTILKLAKLAEVIGDEEYKNEILDLYDTYKNTPEIFINNVKEIGLFFEINDFANLNIPKLREVIFDEFNCKTNDQIKLKKELLEFIKNKLNSNCEIDSIDTDIIYNDIYNSHIYVLKLKHLAINKFTVRSFGEYNDWSKQPIKDKKSNQNRGCHVGTMEFDALIAHDNINTMKEFYGVKSDSVELKKNLINQVFLNNEYIMPKSTNNNSSYTKIIIDSLLTFLDQN